MILSRRAGAAITLVAHLALASCSSTTAVLAQDELSNSTWSASAALDLLEDATESRAALLTDRTEAVGKERGTIDGSPYRIFPTKIQAFLGSDGIASNHHQPRVTAVESLPAQRGFASLSQPRGSVWCSGKPSIWITGHQKYKESPYCETSPGVWRANATVHLDIEDEMNGIGIDRHYCVLIDVNRDGLPDVICGVGATKGTGDGYNELYFTQRDGTLKKMEKGHGLQKYTTMRTRYAATLRNAAGVKEYVFIGTLGFARKDGRTNVHRMFRNRYLRADVLPYFNEVPGPWTYLFLATCAVAGDFNGDSTDDLVVCNKRGPPLLVQQHINGTFTRMELPDTAYTTKWRAVRITDMNGDGLVDLVATTWRSPRPELLIFLGQDGYPYFDFSEPAFMQQLNYPAPDLEILDVNGDNRLDIYVVQADERKEKYCGSGQGRDWWGPSPWSPANWTPPVDAANDLLFVGTGNSNAPFQEVSMTHSYPGCGWLVQRFDRQTMLLGQGSHGKSGFTLLLEW